ncbi:MULTISPECIES: CHAT domain-containing protein [Nostoc]|uniref:CHAT domain-containing protein n=1 Tax=Nostoc paludosum FACHB-159 TaxID=2692908 RepID=A0ABR8KBX7_9NOSO|nr:MULTISPECIES: CHAT domain-containing protein [Nostoc]MBD2680636.1 CHAT domain-containing protein [Nostoc sp. FACHB-857]MBD2737030.1 CHAT domain-containing protein [Nostoc paludosum FACHB-159]
MQIFWKKIGLALFIPLSLVATLIGQQIIAAKSSDKVTQNKIQKLAKNDSIPNTTQKVQILTLYQPLGHLQWEGERVSNTGIAYFSLDSFSNESISESDLDVARTSQDPSKIAKVLATLGLSAHLQGEYDKAINYYKEGLEISKKNAYFELEAILLGNLGLAHVQKGNYYAETIDYLNDYWQLIHTRQQNTKVAQLQEAQALGNLGNAYYGADLYVKAIAFHQKRLALSQKNKDQAGQAKALSDLGIVYQALGDPKKAIDYQQQALTLAQQIKQQSLESFVLGNLGIIYQNQSNYSKASDYYQQRLAIARQLKDLRSEAETLANLAGIAYFQGDYHGSIALFDQGWKISWERLHDGDILYRILGNQGLVHFQMGNLDKALESYSKYFQYASSRNNHREQGIAKINAAAVRLQSGNPAGAAKTLEEAIEIWESLRARLGSNDSFKISIFETQNAPYSNLQAVLVAQNQPEAALQISERGRARALAELLSRRLSTVATQTQAPTTTLASPTIAEIKKIAENHHATLVEYSIVPGNFLVEGKLETHESELLIWVVQPTGNITLRRVDLKPLWQCQNPQLCYPKGLAELVSKTRELLSIRNQSLQISSNVSSVINENPLHQLHQLLIQPINDLLPQDPNNHVIFIPQRSLFLVPFATLPDATGKLLIERHTISISPSIQVLDITYQLRKKPGANKISDSNLIVGNPIMPKIVTQPGEPPEELPPLPGSEQEAKAIAQLFQTKALIGANANKSRVLQQMSNSTLVHLATHGLLSDFRGLGVPGAIALAPDPTVQGQTSTQENGILSASEILDLKLNAQLVVLSACNTGRGKITGDGVVGLSRALVAARVPSVVVSLWALPDEPTSLLMTEFYRNIQHHTDKAVALRQAMLTTMKRYPHPLDWAGFILIGQP